MKSRQQVVQDADIQPQADAGALDIAHRSFHCDEAYPDVLTADDMQRAFRIKRSLFFRLLKAGKFDRFEIKDDIGPRRWSGALVSAHFRAGGDRRAFVFGRKRVG